MMIVTPSVAQSIPTFYPGSCMHHLRKAPPLSSTTRERHTKHIARLRNVQILPAEADQQLGWTRTLK
jgi:hypothetical protein